MVGTLLLGMGGTISGAVPIPSAEAVGSNEQLSLNRLRRHAWTIAVTVVAIARKNPVPAVTTRPLLSETTISNMMRSSELASSRLLINLLRLNAKLRMHPKAVPMAHLDKISIGIRTEKDILSRLIRVERMTRSIVRKARDAYAC